MIKKLVHLTFAVMGIVVVGTGCYTGGNPYGTTNGQSAAGVVGTNSTPLAPDQIRFKPGDTIKVEFSDSELTTIETEVKHDGTIFLAIADKAFKVEGLTAREVEEGIREVYVPNLYKRMSVTVTPGTRFFYVGGEVKQENRFPYSGKITVLKAIQTAGGFSTFANRRKVQITRATGEVITVDCVKLLRNPELDIEILPGDQITVPEGLL